MPYGKFYQAVGRDEKSKTRERLHDVFSSFEKLERELRQHIKQLRLSRMVRDAVPDLERELRQHVEQLRLSRMKRDAVADVGQT